VPADELDEQIRLLVAMSREPGAQDGFGMVGIEDARCLGLLAAVCRARRILEIGTGSALSTLHLARGMRGAGGRLVTLERDPAKAARARGVIAAAGLSSVVELIEGDALDELPRLAGPFDLVFSDAQKTDNVHYFDAFMPKLETGGIVISHDVLCPENRKMRDYLDMLKVHPHLETVMLEPTMWVGASDVRGGPGLSVSRKTGTGLDAVLWSRHMAGTLVPGVEPSCGAPVLESRERDVYQDDYGTRSFHLQVSPGLSRDAVLALCRRVLHERACQHYVSVHVYDDEDAYNNRDNFHFPAEEYFRHLLAQVYRHPRLDKDEIRYYPEKTTYLHEKTVGRSPTSAS